MIIHSHKYSNLQRNYLLIPANSRHSSGFSSLLRRRLESDAEVCCCATVAAGAGATPAAFYLGLCRLRAILPRLHPTTAQQAGRSSLQQQKLESDADRCCGGDRRHSGGFLLRIMPPSCHPVPACTPRLRCRRAILRCRNGPTQADRSTLRRRKLESDAAS